MKRVLVVVDMQTGTTLSRYHRRYLNRAWWARHALVVANIRILAEKMPVIFQIHTNFRQLEKHIGVIAPLKELAAKWPIVYKDQDDGSLELIPHIPLQTHIYICGMNTDACVVRTVLGLRKKGYTVTVVGDACWTVYDSKRDPSHRKTLRWMKNKKIPVVNTARVR